MNLGKVTGTNKKEKTRRFPELYNDGKPSPTLFRGQGSHKRLRLRTTNHYPILAVPGAEFVTHDPWHKRMALGLPLPGSGRLW